MLVKARVLGLLMFMSISNLSWGWSGVISGPIQKIDVAAGENFGFRVYLKDEPAMCGNTNNWAYLNESDSNYKTFVSVLLSAKIAGTPITIYTETEKTTGNNYCHIGHISFH